MSSKFITQRKRNGKQSEYCLGNDSTFLFFENVLSEVIDLFPSPYIHIGGDEADQKNWRKCPKCRENSRFERLNPIKLYDRNCAKCNIEIRTPYVPDRPEIIYCEKCYQQEVY